MAGADRRFVDWPNAALKAHAARLAWLIDSASDEQEQELLTEIVALRDEMQRRLGSSGEDDGAGDREPRRPRPSADSAAAAITPVDTC
jgi:hypothetical protein